MREKIRFMTLHLEPGEGKLFRLTPDLSDIVEENRYFSGDAIVQNDLTFTNNAVMKVYEGTEIQFYPNSHLLFNSGATIQVEGEDNHKVTFTSTNEEGSWGGYGS